MTETIPVPQIHCDHCKMSIEGALQPLPGVNAAAVDIATRTVTVSYDPSAIDLADLRRAIEDQGYDVP
jgi:copper chaperone